MAWVPSYSKEQAAEAISGAKCWADVLRTLGLRVHGKSLLTLRRWAARWNIPTDHLPAYQAVRFARRFTEPQLQAAVRASRSWSETLRHLQYRSAGGNWRTLQKYAALWEIDTSHFDPHDASIEGLRRGQAKKRPLEEILVEGSSYSRAHLKERLFSEGLKKRICELCGQGGMWRGNRIALILDHVNGTPDDNRMDNLRIVCPNCAAALETHCGRKNRLPPKECHMCGREFRSKYRAHKYCSRACGQRAGRKAGFARRRIDRPPYNELIREIDDMGYLAVGRMYGVSDNAIRKWVRWYENEAAVERVATEARPKQLELAADDALDEAA